MMLWKVCQVTTREMVCWLAGLLDVVVLMHVMSGRAEVMDPIKESHLEIDTLHSNSALTAALGSSPSVGNAAV